MKKMFQYFKLLNSRSKTHIRELYPSFKVFYRFPPLCIDVKFEHKLRMHNSVKPNLILPTLVLIHWSDHRWRYPFNAYHVGNTLKHDNAVKNIHLSLYAEYISHFQFTIFLQFILSSNRNGLTPRKRVTLWAFMHSCLGFRFFYLNVICFFNIYTPFPKYF